MPSLAQPKYFVYELSLDRARKYVFYVGKGCGNRPDHHRFDARANRLTLKSAVIRFLLRNKTTYWISFVYRTDDETQAYWHEMKCITAHAPGSLTNLITGYRKPEYRLDIVSSPGGLQGYLIRTKTNEEVGYVTARSEQSINTKAARIYDRIVLRPYFKTIGYKPSDHRLVLG
jgi:hypothetical protein